jgi:large subunit ribosomal protein L30
MTTSGKKIKITQVKSGIGRIKQQKRTLCALGITKNGRSVVQNDNPSVRGMIQSIKHLVITQEVHGE